jgi:prepilin peptidase CpaA
MPRLDIVAATLVFIAACVACDLRTLRIPNVLTGPAILAGLLLNTLSFGWSGFVGSLAGCALAIGLLFGPFALGGVGGGDVKMMGAVGALLGPRLVLQSLLVGIILGGVFAVVRLAGSARLREKLLATWRMVANAVLARSVAPLKAPASEPNPVVLPYSLPLGLGTVGVLALSMVATS